MLTLWSQIENRFIAYVVFLNKKYCTTTLDIHKILNDDKGRTNISPRMLIIKVADDAASQYLSFMNVIFAGMYHYTLVTISEYSVILEISIT